MSLVGLKQNSIENTKKIDTKIDSKNNQFLNNGNSKIMNLNVLPLKPLLKPIKPLLNVLSPPIATNDLLDTYDKTKKWLSENVHKNFFPSNPEFGILCSLVDRHPSKDEWKNQIPVSFKISRSPGNGNLVLYVRFDGTTKYRIISWVACSKGKLAKQQESGNVDSQLNGAMRYSIRVQISNYRKNNPTPICALCQTTHRIEVDHYPKHFVELRDDFIKSQLAKNLTPPNEFKWHSKRGNFMFKDGNKANNYYDKSWKQSWQRYHNSNATYRYLCSTCNKKTNQ